MFAGFGKVELPSSVHTFCTGAVSGLSLFNHTAVICSPSLSDEMLCSLFCLFPKGNYSTVHYTATTVITKITDPSHKPMLDGHVRILRGAIFPRLPQIYHCIIWSSKLLMLLAVQFVCRQWVSGSGLSVKDRSLVPVVCICCTWNDVAEFFYSHVMCI